MQSSYGGPFATFARPPAARGSVPFGNSGGDVVGLREDGGYLAYQAARSQEPTLWWTSLQAGTPPATVIDKPVVGVPASAVPASRAFYESTRVEVSAAEHRPETPLFGTAPYRARGDGILYDTDTSSALQFGETAPQRTRAITETDFTPYTKSFIDIKPAVQPITAYAGVSTRFPPRYVNG